MRFSPLDAQHRLLDAKMVPFGGWDMPLAYPSGTLAEHAACRTGAVIFDVSHLGTVRVEGPTAFDQLQACLTNDLSRIAPGRAQYTHLLDKDDASVLDDIIVWWVSDQVFDVMPNASNTDRVVAAIGGYDTTATRAVIAVQGPEARVVVEKVCVEAAAVKRFTVEEVQVCGFSCVVAGTGYTGEDGIEIAVPSGGAAVVWNALCGAGAIPAGLGARDTLRLEAGLPLHGHELGEGISSLQAGLEWVVAWNKPNFHGREALLTEKEQGVSRRLVGISIPGRRPARDGTRVLDVAGNEIGSISSGNFSPTLGHCVAMAFVKPSTAVGDSVSMDVRGTLIEGVVVATPFVAKKK
ncbi:MAG: glycine cleavage system aminomethyltransferase GcvT [Actinobacteria bacterium]|nr:glycine cleavage system aminomethyltransferase GcvT [Actinomycetota bacterium]